MCGCDRWPVGCKCLTSQTIATVLNTQTEEPEEIRQSVKHFFEVRSRLLMSWLKEAHDQGRRYGGHKTQARRPSEQRQEHHTRPHMYSHTLSYTMLRSNMQMESPRCYGAFLSDMQEVEAVCGL